MRKVAAVFGTRPERIKLGPVADALEERGVEVEWLFTNQSPDLVDDEEDWYRIPGDWEDLRFGVSKIVDLAPVGLYDAVLVQGDTASAFAGAVAGFLAEVPVGHIEAGLRTYRREPWPEEAFRGAIARFATWHFCPDEIAADNIMYELQSWGAEQEGGNVFVTGNPIIDALPSQPFRVLVTLHRRENWGAPNKKALDVMEEFVADHGETTGATIVEHPNWEDQGIKRPHKPGVYYSTPVEHSEFLEMLEDADLVVTDSGGLQEEAAYLGTDCIVYRSATERTALEASGAVEIVDPTNDPQELRSALERRYERRMAYGSGDAGKEIADILVRELSERREPTERMKELADEAE